MAWGLLTHLDSTGRHTVLSEGWKEAGHGWYDTGGSRAHRVADRDPQEAPGTAARREVRTGEGPGRSSISGMSEQIERLKEHLAGNGSRSRQVMYLTLLVILPAPLSVPLVLWLTRD